MSRRSSAASSSAWVRPDPSVVTIPRPARLIYVDIYTLVLSLVLSSVLLTASAASAERIPPDPFAAFLPRGARAFDEKGREVAGLEAYWFAWAAFHPRTVLASAGKP